MQGIPGDPGLLTPPHSVVIFSLHAADGGIGGVHGAAETKAVAALAVASPRRCASIATNSASDISQAARESAISMAKSFAG